VGKRRAPAAMQLRQRILYNIMIADTARLKGFYKNPLCRAVNENVTNKKIIRGIQMRHIITLGLLLMAATAQSAQVTIDFEEFSRGPVNPPSYDLTTKGFVFDYLNQGSGYPLIETAGTPNGTQGYMNCPSCVAVEQIDLSIGLER
jgi:hypothetical protein